MSDVLLKVESLSKKYNLFHERQEGYKSFREIIMSRLKSVHSKNHYTKKKEDFWVLKDINFEVKRGDTLGIIGRNGAGKSTLLKLLSRIIEPTAGRIEISGRIASLLEVGTGFHPELTGRENIFLNGAVLGMGRKGIMRQFDSIVDFSGTEKFLDTPVKRYSSGMYVRLAFSVAAHLDPDILIVDEVLAVGDADFQRKCLGKMHDVAKQGDRTVLFVSHNMSAIQHLCKNGIYLRDGVISKVGQIGDVIKEYALESQSSEIFTSDGFVSKIEVTQNVDEIHIIVDYCVYDIETLLIPYFGFVITDSLGSPICGFNPSMLKGAQQRRDYKNNGQIKIILSEPKLLDSHYYLSFWFSLDGHTDIQHVKNALSFKIQGMVLTKQLATSLVGYCSPKCTYQYI
jgi:lipopolysaccharide transport system ATP-binding protein